MQLFKKVDDTEEFREERAEKHGQSGERGRRKGGGKRERDQREIRRGQHTQRKHQESRRE